MKYNIIISAINTEQAPFTATGSCDQIEFEARTIHYNGGLIWKVVEQGMCPAPVDLSAFTRGQRSSIARWLKQVEGNPELVGKSSQTVGSTSSSNNSQARQKAEEEKAQMQNEINELKAMVQALLEQKK